MTSGPRANIRTWSIAGAVIALVTSGCTGDPAEPDRPSTVTGVVIDVESPRLGVVEGFVLRDEGRRYDITVTDETDFSFPPGHLNEHLVTGDPVRVELSPGTGAREALSVSDG